MVTVPVFAAQHIPKIARILFGIALGTVLSAAMPAQSYQTTGGILSYVTGLVAELLWGLSLGLGVSLLLEAARLAGEIVDLQMGFRIASLFDPISSSQIGVFSHIYYLATLLIFLQLNGHHWVLEGLRCSFQICPVGAITCGPQLTEIFVALTATVFQLGLRLGAPLILAAFLSDLALGLVCRMVPQMNVFIVGIPAKIALGLAMMVACAPLLSGVFSSLMTGFKAYLEQMLHLLNAGAG